ncbi:MAG: pentapeptide repeat-containing protein [Aminipila sp.]
MKDSDIIDSIEELSAMDETSFLSSVGNKDQDLEYLEGRYINNVNVQGYVFSGIEGERLYFENCIFTQCEFEKAYFKETIFKQCDFSNSNFKNSTFSNCKMENVKCVGTNFSDSGFKRVCITDCILRYAVLTNSILNSLYLEESDLSEAYLDECKTKMFSAKDVNFERANFYKTSLKGIDLRTSQIKDIVFSKEAIELRGAIVDLFQAAELAKSLGIIIK